MLKSFSFLLFVFFSASAMGQSAKLEGTVRDADTGEPIAIATVALYQNGVLVTGTETDFDGNYSLTEIAPGGYSIEFILRGYMPKKIENYFLRGGRAKKLDIKMEVNIEIVDVCCYRPPLIEQDNTTQGHIFRIEDIRNSPIR